MSSIENNPAHDQRSLTKLRAQLSEVLQEHSTVRWAYLFGSAARGNEEYQDVDVGLVLDAEARGAVALGSIIAHLEAALPNERLDVIDLQQAAPALRGSVVREGLLLVDRHPDERSDWEVEVLRVALDIEPWLARFDELRREALKKRS